MPLAAQLFSTGDKALILRGLMEACDALDGRKDGIIANPAACRFRPASLGCAGAKQPGCLSGPQVQALASAFEAPRDGAGALLYAAFPYDSGIVSEGPGIPGFLPSASPSPLGPPRRDLTIDLDKMAQTVRDDPGQALTDSDRWTNLSGFVGHGGRMIFYHGMSDPWFSPWDTLDFVRRAGAATPGWSEASRLYLVPGMGHCSGGANSFDSFDMLGQVVAWVEEGKAPAAVTAARSVPSPETRPLCPFPSYPRPIGGALSCVTEREGAAPNRQH